MPSSGRALALVSGGVALGVVALFGVMAVSQGQVRARRPVPVALASPLTLVDLQPTPAEASLKPIKFHQNKASILHASGRFMDCVDAAATVDEGVWCMGQVCGVASFGCHVFWPALLAAIPRPRAS
jgi:hypothetical protein